MWQKLQAAIRRFHDIHEGHYRHLDERARQQHLRGDDFTDEVLEYIWAELSGRPAEIRYQLSKTELNEMGFAIETLAFTEREAEELSMVAEIAAELDRQEGPDASWLAESEELSRAAESVKESDGQEEAETKTIEELSRLRQTVEQLRRELETAREAREKMRLDRDHLAYGIVYHQFYLRDHGIPLYGMRNDMLDNRPPEAFHTDDPYLVRAQIMKSRGLPDLYRDGPKYFPRRWERGESPGIEESFRAVHISEKSDGRDTPKEKWVAEAEADVEWDLVGSDEEGHEADGSWSGES